MAKKYRVRLFEDERKMLHQLVSSGKGAARKITRAHLLLAVDEGGDSSPVKDEDVAKILHVGIRTVERLRKTFIEEGIDIALNGRKTRRVYKKT